MRRALITGGAVRIGREIALHLASRGYQIILHYNSSHVEALKTYAEICKIADLKHDLVQCNLLSNWEELLVFSKDTLIINNASVFCDDYKPLTPADILKINYQIPLALSQAFASNGGAAINLLDAQSVSIKTDKFETYHRSKKMLSLATAKSKDLTHRICGLLLGATMFKDGQDRGVFDKVRAEFASDISDVIWGIDTLIKHNEPGIIIDLTMRK